MEKCHRHVVALVPYLIKNKKAFMYNNKSEIENELKNILQKIDDIVYNTHNIDTLTKSIYDKDYPLSEIFREFLNISNKRVHVQSLQLIVNCVIILFVELI